MRRHSAPIARRVIIAGAGAVGSAIAATLAQRGATVIWADPAEGDNASGVAAGMLAPAFEAALDGGGPETFALLKAARDQWTDLLASLGDPDVGLWRGGALWLDLPGAGGLTVTDLKARFEALGAQAEAVSAATARDFLPSLPTDLTGALYTPEDWSLDPLLALAALRSAAVSAGVEVIRERVIAFEGGAARLSDGRIVAADTLVLATGADTSPIAPETAHLTPIKGHILRQALSGRQSSGPVLRGPGGYVCATASGVHVGATMEPGVSDRAVDPAVTRRLKAFGERLYPVLVGAELEARTGVRAATPDGLPLVGPSATPGVLLAVGMRRNGWLLAPLVAEMIAAYLTGDNPGAHAAWLNPRRFEVG
jgi:glycine oxidase